MFSDRLLEARKQAGLSQRRLAALLGERYDRSMIGHVENGRRHLLMDGAMKAAQVLDVSLDYLVGLSDDPTPTAESAAELQRTKEEGSTACGGPLPRLRAQTPTFPRSSQRRGGMTRTMRPSDATSPRMSGSRREPARSRTKSLSRVRSSS